MSNETISLPRELRRQFEALERRLWRIDIAIAACGAAGALILSCGLQFISDRFWDTPSWLRAFFTLLGFGILLYFVHGYARRWVWGARGFEFLASLVQKRYRRLGDRLLGIVELADTSRRSENVSPALCAAAIAQVAAEAARIDFREAASPKKSYRHARVLALVLAVAAVPCFLAPQASLNALKRWIWPGARVARYTFVRLGDLPASKVVPRGEAFEIACSVENNWLWRPSWASCRFEDQAAIDTPVIGGKILFHIPGQTRSGFLTLRAGDVTRRIFIEPVYRPELTQLLARVDLPAYLGYPRTVEKIEGGSFAVLRGTLVSLEGTTARALQSARMQLTAGAGGASRAEPLEVHGSGFRSGPLVLEGFSQCVLQWKDAFGLEAPAPAIFKLQTKEDAPPEVECPGLAEAIAILREEVVNIPLSARDDYGLHEMGLAWEVATRSGKKAEVPDDSRTVQKGGAQVRGVEGRHGFQPSPAATYRRTRP